MTLGEWATRIRSYLNRELWESDPERRSRLSAIRLLQFSIMLGEGFVRDKLLLRAGGLSYFTVLSVVPLLAVAVAIASSVGAGSAGFVEWVVGTMAAGAPGAEETIRGLVEGVDFTGLGTLGGGILLVTTVLAISNVERTLNDIWGVVEGRGWGRRFSDYLAVIVVAPLLGGLALSLAATLRSQWAMSQLLSRPAFGPLAELGVALVPVFMLSVALTFLYWFLPNTQVRPASGMIGGVFAGAAVVLAQSLYVEFSVGAARASTFFGGFAQLPLLFAWIYVFWAIVLLGAEIAFAHQNFALYRQEVRGDPAGPAEREAIALRIALEVARRFRAGGPAVRAAGLADELQVPVRTVRAVASQLQAVGILSARADDRPEQAFQLGRPADTVAIADVLGALRGHWEAPRGDRATGALVARVMGDLEAAALGAAGDRTLADLLAELPPDELASAARVDPPAAQP